MNPGYPFRFAGRPSRNCLLAVAVAVTLAVPGGEALATHVSCGDTITTDTTLDTDLIDCPNNGIVIGADDITLDLNGHTIDGDNALVDPCPGNEFCDVGVLNDGHDDVTVRNGSVREFALGAFMGRARRNRVLGISSSRNTFFGFVLVDVARSLVRDSSGSGNLRPDGDGMGLFGSHDVRVLQNSFRHNPLGMHVEDSADNLIKENVISGNSGPGILMQADHNEIRRNTCARNKSACIIVSSGDRNLIARNHAFRDGGGIGIEEGKRNVVTRNEIVRPRKTGINLGFRPNFGGGHNIVRRNQVRGTGFDGFLVTQKDDHSILRRNTAEGAGDDGFDIESPSTTLTSNLAVRNDDLGIAAVGGVIDGGGNRASGNGDPRQCVNVTCR
jgi:parallel beta-helix repeat protein